MGVDLEKLYNAIDQASQDAYGGDEQGDLANDRANAISRYLGKNIIPAPDGRSQVVDRTVYETIQWVQPSLARIFANGDDVVEVVPVGPEDEESAKSEGQYLNYVALQRNNWPEIFDTASKDAQLSKMGYLYVYRKDRRQVELETYKRQTPEGVALILQDKPDIVDVKEYPDDTPQQPQVDPQTGQQVTAPPAMLYDLTIRRTKTEPHFCIEALPPERVKVSTKCTTVQLKDCPYFEYYDYPTISDLRADGLDVADDVGEGMDPYDSAEDQARNRYGETQNEISNDPAMRRVLTRWCWIRYDADEDGIAELQYCIVVGKEVIHREEVSRIPVGVLCADPLPHRHIGLCSADTVADIQDIKTVIQRGALDNLNLSNNIRMFINPSMVNLDDALVSRPGGVIRGKQGAVFGNDIAPIQTPFVFPQAMEALGFMEQAAEGRTGVNKYFQGTDQNALNKTASGIQQLSTMASQRVEQHARNYAPGLVEMFAVLHELILKSGKLQDKVKLSGKWMQVDPTTWRKRTDFKLSVGYASGNKDALVNRLMMIAQLQEKAAAGGLPIVNPQNMYETALEITKASDFSSPQRFWTDPATVPPQPPQPDPLMAIEQLKSQTTLQKTQADNQVKLRTNSEQLMLEKYRIDKEAELKAALAQFEAGIKSQMEAETRQHDMNLEGLKLEGVAKIEHVKAALDPKQKEIASQDEAATKTHQGLQATTEQLSSLLEHVQNLHKVLSAPRTLIRDKAGRPVGSKVEL